MISLHAYDTQDFSGNGVCGLYPEVCDVKKVAAGLYEVELVHPLTDDGRALSIQRGMLIKAPVPARETPLITNWHEGNAGQPGHVIYETNITTGQTGGYVRIYTKADSASKVLQKLKNHVEFIFHSNIGSNWVKGTSAEGTTGYLYKPNVRYVRTEMEIPSTPCYNTVVLPRQIREQLFRVYDVNTDTKTNKVKALARHISYDQLRNFVKSYNPKDVLLQTALDAMSADMINPHDFNYYTNVNRTITSEWALKNGVQTILDPDLGAAPKMNAQVVRDNFDVFLLENTEIDRGVVIESGKNLLGMVCGVNDDNVVTRIMPYGTDKDGKMLFLPEVHIDSPYIGNYPTERAIPLQVQEAVERAASGDNPGMTKEQCYEKMRAAVQAQYDAGIDLPTFDIQVDFLQLGDTEEYKALKNLQQVYLYDTVTVRHGRLGMLYKTQVTGFTFDAVLRRYTSVTLGGIKNGADLGVIAGFQIPNSGIAGMKLMPGSVGSGQLRELSVLAAHIGLAQIVNAHIQDATIDKAKIKEFVAEVGSIAVAKIGEAWIDAAWIDKLTAEVVDIVTANIDTLIANNATINWAQIANLTAAVTDIVLAKIQTANINWAHITGLVADTTLFTQGASGKLYCADFMATDANIESLSANKIAGGMATFGKLMLMGQNGKLYEINVGSLGEVTAQEKKLTDGNVGDYSLVDRNLASGTLTARTLNVQSIFADNALVRQLIAQSIDTNTLFANMGYINALRTYLIQSDIGQFLNLQSNTGIQLLVNQAVGKINPGNPQLLSTDPVRWETTTYLANYGTSDGRGNAYIRNITPIPVSADTAYTIACTWQQWGTGVSVLYLSAEGYLAGGVGRFTDGMPHTFTIPAGVAYLRVLISWTNYLTEIPSIGPGHINDKFRYKLEAGSTATGWLMSTDDPARVVETATALIDALGFVLTGGRFHINTNDFLVHTLSSGIDAMSIDAAGNADFKAVSSDSVLAPDVHPVYTGPSTIPWAGSINATIDKVRNKHLKYNCSFIVPDGIYYENVIFEGISGADFSMISNYGPTLVGSIVERNCTSRIVTRGESWDYFNLLAGPGIANAINITDVDHDIQYMRITGRVRTSATDGTSKGIYATGRCSGIIHNNIIERTVDYAGQAGNGVAWTVENNVGGASGGGYATLANLGYGIVMYGIGDLFMKAGTCPVAASGPYQAWYGNLHDGTPTPTGSPGTAPPAPTTRMLTYAITSAGTIIQDPNWKWMSSVNIAQAWQTSNTTYGERLPVWILANAANIPADIGTGTVISGKLKLQRSTAYGDTGAVNLHLKYHAYSTRAAVPTGASRPVMVDIMDVLFARGEQKSIDLPASVLTGLKSGAVRGFGGLNSSPAMLMQGDICTLEITVQGGP